MSIPIVPALIPQSQQAIVDVAQRVNWSHEFQLDLVDGKFVEAASWPYAPVGDPLEVKTQLDAFTLEVDLMVVDPLAAAKKWLQAGADMLVFHVETVSLGAFVQFAEVGNVSIGVSAHGATTLEILFAYAEHADYIQLMGIYEIGAQGLPFDEQVLEKIAACKQRFPEKMVSIDGSVNAATIERLYKAGADRFVCGSAIVLQEDPQAAHAALSALINE